MNTEKKIGKIFDRISNGLMKRLVSLGVNLKELNFDANHWFWFLHLQPRPKGKTRKLTNAFTLCFMVTSKDKDKESVYVCVCMCERECLCNNKSGRTSNKTNFPWKWNTSRHNHTDIESLESFARNFSVCTHHITFATVRLCMNKWPSSLVGTFFFFRRFEICAAKIAGVWRRLSSWLTIWSR